jgi:multiple sugar transport system substrate-binding protein
MQPNAITRREFLRLTAMLGGAAVLGACGSAPTQPVAESTAAPAVAPTSAPAAIASALSGEIEYATYDLGPANESRKAAITAFETATPGAKVKLTVLPYEELWQKLAAQMATGQTPDVIYGDFSLLRYALDGKLLDLTERLKSDAVLSQPDAFITNMTDDMQAKYGTQRVHALIMGTWVPILYFNRDIFDAAKEPYPTEDWTWDDLRIAAQRLTKPADKQYGFQFGTTLDNVGWMWWGQQPGDFWATPQIFPEKTQFNSPAGLEVMSLYHTLSAQDKSAVSPEEGKTYDVYAGAFGAGKVAMYTGGDWDAGWSFRELPFKWGMTLTPKMRKDYRPSLNTMLSSNVISASTKNPDLAWAFIRFLTASPEGATVIGQGAYETPVLREVATSKAIMQPEWAVPGYEARVKAAQLPGTMYTPYPLNLNLWEFPSKYLDETILKLRTGEMQPQEAVEYLDKEGNPYFQQQKAEMKTK